MLHCNIFNENHLILSIQWKFIGFYRWQCQQREQVMWYDTMICFFFQCHQHKPLCWSYWYYMWHFHHYFFQWKKSFLSMISVFELRVQARIKTLQVRVRNRQTSFFYILVNSVTLIPLYSCHSQYFFHKKFAIIDPKFNITWAINYVSFSFSRSS